MLEATFTPGGGTVVREVPEAVTLVVYLNEFDTPTISTDTEEEAVADVEWEKLTLPHLSWTHTNYFLMEVQT